MTMISVIFYVLKIIGIIILAVIGILLAFLMAVLFVPVRYRINAEYDKNFEMNAVVSWLFHIIHARIEYSEKKWRFLIRIFGILVYNSLRPPKHKKKKDAADEGSDNFRNDAGKNDTFSDTDETKSEILKEKTDVLNEKTDGVNEKTDILNEKTYALKEKTESEYNKYYKNSKDEKENSGYKDSGSCYCNRNQEADAYTEDKKFSVKKIKEKLKKIKSAIVAFFKNIAGKIKKTIQSLKNIKHKVSLILDFLRNETNKEGFRFTFETVKKILKHIKPARLRSDLTFGTGDPCSTGQILGLLGILYGFYGNAINITPDFENRVLKGSLYARGRIRLGTILIIIIRFLLDRRFKELKANYQLLKEAL